MSTRNVSTFTGLGMTAPMPVASDENPELAAIMQPYIDSGQYSEQ